MTEVYLNRVTTALGSVIEQNSAVLSARSPEDADRLVRKIGVVSRHIAAPNEFTSDLAIVAASELFADPALHREDCGALIVCTQTPDHLIPGVSSKVHGALSLRADCFVMDINQGCSGFVVGAQTIGALLRSREVDGDGILINADVYSRLIRPDDLTTRVLFGDAATACQFSTRRGGLRLAYSRSFADGSGYDAFVARDSALRKNEEFAAGIHMDGPGILNFALRVVPEAIARALKDNGLAIEQISMFAFHQANSFVIGQLQKKLKLSAEQAPQNCAHLGNTVSASIPLLLAEHMDRLRPGNLVLAVGFGVGLSWGVALFEKVAES